MREFQAGRFVALFQSLMGIHQGIILREGQSLAKPPPRSIFGRLSRAGEQLLDVHGRLAEALKTNLRVSREALLATLKALSEECQSLGLLVSLAEIRRSEEKLKASNEDELPFTPQDIENIWNRIYDELSQVTFFGIGGTAINYYKTEERGWKFASKYPHATTDIDEAGKCLALGRYTASVFHLMRVMEIALRELGVALAADLREKDGWLTILHKRIDPAINGLPETSSEERHRKTAFQQVRAHLHAVRLAWRNDTMHPKATYTEEEAIELIEHVRSFTNHLTKLL
jgi:hypothetical protein